MKVKTPWQKIRDAAEKGTGTRLTSEECARLACDNAIVTRAELDDEDDDVQTNTDRNVPVLHTHIDKVGCVTVQDLGPWECSVCHVVKTEPAPPYLVCFDCIPPPPPESPRADDEEENEQ